jgi:hypothetical protein
MDAAMMGYMVAVPLAASDLLTTPSAAWLEYDPRASDYRRRKGFGSTAVLRNPLIWSVYTAFATRGT